MKKLEVIKIGGKVIDNKEHLAAVLYAFAKIKGPKILVHGGGSKASEMEKILGLTPNMAEGRRITDAQSLEVVTMVYAGLINKNIVAGLQANGCNAIGLSGADANVICSQKRPLKLIDYGFVGDVKSVNSNFISKLAEAGLTPVFSAITHDGNGQLLNTNADTMAAEIATAMSARYEVALTLAFEKSGVLDAKGNVIEKITEAKFSQLKEEKVIIDGMIPKLSNAFDALRNGVKEVRLTSAEYLTNKKLTYTSVRL
ncbi:Acetylglutamate kinase [hydrothermal vent metagenome]|uniref:Acetylglutamate kinase n=1 Tax=hydrothermal vent metagenome TaxID=652676 RepID=A0A3B0UVG9_9ZZZZ